MKINFKKILMPLAIFTLAIGATVSLSSRSDVKGANAAAGDVLTTWSDKASGYTTGYKSQTATIDGVKWLMTSGQSGFFGANKADAHTKAYMTGDALNAALAVDSTWSTTKTGMYGIIAQSPLLNVNKVEFKYTADSGSSASTKVYLAYSDSLKTPYQLVPLSSGTQGSTPGSSKTVSYSFNTISSAYYALLFKTSAYSRFTNSTAAFYEGVSATGSIEFNETSHRLRPDNSIVISPTLSGEGVLEATVADPSIASVSVEDSEITINALKVGSTKVFGTFGGAKAEIDIEVFEPNLVLDKETVTVNPMGQISVEAEAYDFIPTSYSWTKEDPNNLLTMTGEDTAIATFEAGNDLGEVVATLVATDGVDTKSASVLIKVAELVEGSYTLTAASADYVNQIVASSLAVDKTDAALEDLVFSNIDNTRLNSSPNSNMTIVIGGTSTAGGKFTVKLPDNLFATEVTFNGMIVDSGKTPTLKINDGVKFTYANKASETLHPYANSLEISTVGTSRIWVSSIEIKTMSAENAASDFAAYLLSKTDDECANQKVLAATWNDLAAAYNGAAEEIKDIIKSVEVNNDGTDLEKALGRYDFICAKYGYTDFISGATSPVIHRDNNIKTNDNKVLVTLVSLLGLTSIAGYYFLNKKKKTQE